MQFIARVANDSDGNVLRDDVIVLENDDNFNFKLDLKVVGDQRRTGKEARKNHVNGYHSVSGHLAVADLNVLYLGNCWVQRGVIEDTTEEKCIPSHAYPSAQPHVSTRTSCSSMLLIICSQCSIISSPVKGSHM